MTADEVIRVANDEWEQGYYAKKYNSDINNRVGGDPYKSGDSKKYTFYAQDLYDKRYYSTNTNGSAWCTIFADWCVLKAANFDISTAKSVKPPSSSVMKVMYYAERTGTLIKKDDVISGTASVLPGDMVLAETNGDDSDGPDHIGIVVAVEGTGRNTVVYTIEGNTSGSSVTNRTCIRANPDPYNKVNYASGVYKKKMPITSKYINSNAFFRPNYSTDPTPTPKEFNITVNSIAHLITECDKYSGHEGDTISVNVTPEKAYIITNLVVSVNGTPIEMTLSGEKYIGSFVLTGETNISVTGAVRKAEYNINIVQLENTITTCSTLKAEYGETVTISLQPYQGFNITNPEAHINGSNIEFTQTGNLYTGEFILTKDTTITISGTVTQVSASINLTNLCEAFEVSCASSGDLGTAIPITIMAKNHYTITGLQVFVNGSELKLTKSSDDSYIGSFTLVSNTDVVVDGTALPNTYVITTAAEDHTGINCVTSGLYGEIIRVEAFAVQGYTLQNPELTVNGTTIILSQLNNEYIGYFTLTQNSALVLTGDVSEDSRSRHTVQCNPVENIIIDIPEYVYDGDNLTITVKPSDNYIIAQLNVIANSELVTMTETENVFTGTISNIQQDIVINISGTVTPVPLYITIQCPDSIDVTCSKNPGFYNDDIIVTASAKDGYQINKLSILINGISSEVLGTSTTFKLKSNTQILVIGDIIATKFNIVSRADIGIVYDCVSSGRYGEEITVKFSAANGYTLLKPLLLVNGTSTQLISSDSEYIGRFILTQDTQVVCSGDISKDTFTISKQPLKNVTIICKDTAEINEEVLVQFYANKNYIITTPMLMVNTTPVALSKDGKIYSGSFLIKEDTTIMVTGVVVPNSGEIETQVSFYQNEEWTDWTNIQNCTTPTFVERGTYTIKFKVRYYLDIERSVIKSFPEDSEHYEIPFTIS